MDIQKCISSVKLKPVSSQVINETRGSKKAKALTWRPKLGIIFNRQGLYTENVSKESFHKLIDYSIQLSNCGNDQFDISHIARHTKIKG